MEVILIIFLFFIGIIFLYFGAEALVRGSVRIAKLQGIPPLIMGLTVVAFGTSAPEFTVSLVAAIQKNQDISVGNIVGSNIANVGLIIGVSALVQPLFVNRQILIKESPFMLLTSLFVFGFFYNSYFSRLEGAILLLCLVIYIIYIIMTAKKEQVNLPAESLEEDDESEKFVTQFPISIIEKIDNLLNNQKSYSINIIITIIGIILLTVGSNWLIMASRELALLIGISDVVVGVSIVAIGTSLPELATSIVSVMKKESDIAVGNVVGSNLYNILFVLGIIGITKPLKIDNSISYQLVPIMILFSLVFVLFMVTRKRVVRWEAALLLVGYIIFMNYLYF